MRSICVFILAALSLQNAGAYIYNTCDGNKIKWPLPTAGYRPMNVSFPSGSSQRVALERARDGWNATVPGRIFFFTFNYTSETHWESGDGLNRIAFTWDYDWGSSTLGVTLNWRECETLVESDILFHPNKNWNFSHHPAPNASGTKFVLVALHEFGHGMGLKHEDRWMATMNSVYPNSGVFGNENDPDPFADDCAGNGALYGSSSARDLAVSVYQRTGWGTSNIISPPSSAQKGTVKTFRFTLLNRGNLAQNGFTLKVYASSDRWISINDSYLGTATYWLTPGASATVDLNIYIPYSLPSGYRYFGFIADPSNVVGEWAEDQNAVAYVTRTNVY